MADESINTSMDEDQDFDEINNLSDLFEKTFKDLFEENPDINESTSSYKSQIKSRIDIIRQLRRRGLTQSGVLNRMYQTNISNIKLTNFPRLNIFNKKRQEEKDNIIQLNDNLAKYIQIIKFLEIQNKKLIIQIEVIQNAIQQNSSSIKNIYQIEISEANKIIQELQNADQIDIEQINNYIENQQILMKQINELHQINQNPIDLIQRTISQTDADIILFRRRLSDIDDEIYRYKIESTQIISKIKSLQTRIENEIFLKIIFQREKNSFENEINSTLLTYETEINELRLKYFSINFDPSIIFHNELSESIKKLRLEYQEILKNEKDSLHNEYLILINQFNINKQNIQFNKDQQQQNKFHQLILQSENKNIYLKEKNQKLNNQINHFQILINQLQQKNNQISNEKLTEIEQMKRRLEKLDLNYHQISSIQISLEKEIDTYRQLLEGRHGLQIHIDRIFKEINKRRETSYWNIIPKKNLQLKKIKDFRRGIFLDTSESTSNKLKSIGKTILEVELSICDLIQFDDIVIWNTEAFICTNISNVESNGIRNPSSIFENKLTKDVFKKSDVIIFITNGEIEHKNVTKFASNLKNNLNKILIICIIIQENIEDRSLINISVIAPLLFASNVLCLLFDGQIFSVILSKGLINKSYPISSNSINLKDILNKIELNENILIEDDLLILNDNLNESIYFDFNKFILLKNLDEMILIKENEWKLIIQYGKINNRIDELKYFISRMIIDSNNFNLQTILKQFDQNYLNKKNIIEKQILFLKETNYQQNNQSIIKLEKQLNHIFNQFNQDKHDYINQNIHFTYNYWNQILDFIYQQQSYSYFIKHFYFD